MSLSPPERKGLSGPVAASLMGLPSPAADFPASNGAKAATILRLLRQLALKSRQKQARPFYSIRTVARRFDVPLTTVARIYAQLKKEGILGSVWGSSTVVEPYELDKELRIRGIVALPASLKAFCALRNYRILFENMQTALWRNGFATRQLFYENGDAAKPAFSEALLHEKVDVVLWLLPDPAELAGSKRLLDRGVRVVSLVDSLIANGRTDYRLSRLHALKEVLNLWKTKGIRFVTIVHKSGSGSTTSSLEAIRKCLDEVRMAHTLAMVSSSPTGQARSLCRQNNTAIIFPVSESALQLAYEHPRDFALLIKQHPVLLMEGMLDLPINISSHVGVEAIEFDWRPVVNRLAGDLFKWKRLSGAKPIIFHAKCVHQRVKGYAAAA
ncbi:MAG TPA: hypothetical protein VEP30_01090 [Chthoniobacterales bacterium]|nr:hypothetical protein [Chthoniobacterales bacterium]